MSHIDYEVLDHVATITMNRPEKHNGLTLDMLDDLAKAAKSAAKNKKVRAVVVTGSGPSFCSGLDFASAGKEPKRIMRNFVPKRLSSANTFQAAAWEFRSVPAPVIAVINGYCFGGGLQIALGADFRFSHPDATYSVLEAKWGMIPDMAASMSLSQLTSIDVAKRLTMTGEVFTAEFAKDNGIVTEVNDHPLDAANAFIKQILQRSPDAIAASKKLFDTTWNNGTRTSFPVEQALQLRLMSGRNHRIAREAGLNKQAAAFRDRQF